MRTAMDEALSVDGRTFTGTLSLDSGRLVGEIVVVRRGDGQELIGPLLHFEASRKGGTREGRFLAALMPDGAVSSFDPSPFSGGTILTASPETLAAFDSWSRVDLHVGTHRAGGEDALAMLRKGGFNRHTFLCGQSGSGKTYALGVILERLLAYTGLRMIILDPNADYVRLGEVRPEAEGEVADLVRAARVTVLRSGDAALAEPGTTPLTVAFTELSAHARAAILEVEPLGDREEYNALLDFIEHTSDVGDAAAFFDHLSSSDRPVDRAIAQRIANLGLLGLSVWARGRESLLTAASNTSSRALVLDVAGFTDPRERSIAALALLDHLWANREKREPVLLVIDEAHNLCSDAPTDALQAAVTDRLVQIAAEGRKYGLWLLLSTQRPSKINRNVLSQCDNLMLMRMNSPGDLAELEAIFGSVPTGMLAAATTFRQGEILLAGGFTSAPRIARIGERLTFQGGSDVDVPDAAVPWGAVAETAVPEDAGA